MTGRKGNWFIGMGVRCYGVSWANFTLAGLMDGYGSHQGKKKKKALSFIRGDAVTFAE